MTETVIEVRKITADEGMVLTNGKAYSEVGGDIFLGCNDSKDNWHEITDAEYDAILKEQEEEINEDIY